MSIEHCAELVAETDPPRFRPLALIPPEKRVGPLAIYALNIEVGRAAWASAEPMVAEMRLQWWRDAIEEITGGAPARAHPVLSEAQPLLIADPVAGALWDRLIEARRWDIWQEPFANADALRDHLDATAGGVMWLAARALGAAAGAEATVRDLAAGAGLADWFRAVPGLVARGRHPLPDPSPEGIAALAAGGIERIRAARRARGQVPDAALAALLPGAEAEALLRLAAQEPARVAEGRLARPAIHERWNLAWRSALRRW